MADYSKEQRVYKVFQNISKGYDRANDRISLGLQNSWKKMLLDRLTSNTPSESAILDVCCGTGDISLKMASKRADLKMTGLDFSPAMLKVAKEKNQYENVCFVRGNAMELPFADNSFEAVCISFGLRNTSDYAQVLREMKRVVKPGGYLYCLDSFVPDNCLIQPFYNVYFRYVMPLLGGGKEHRKEYMWLYRSTRQFLHTKELMTLFKLTGLVRVKEKRKMFGACVLIWGRKLS